MDLGLSGRRVLITGGSRGIGFATAESLAAEGAAIGLVARDPDGLASAARQLADRGVRVATASADVTDTPALNRAVEQIAAALGGLDHLVANAGGTAGSGNLTSAGDDEFTATFALNAGHAAELIRAALPHLRRVHPVSRRRLGKCSASTTRPSSRCSSGPSSPINGSPRPRRSPR
jgi:3-oxoacyl-[acyl-carrier protein] reductase